MCSLLVRDKIRRFGLPIWSIYWKCTQGNNCWWLTQAAYLGTGSSQQLSAPSMRSQLQSVISTLTYGFLLIRHFCVGRRIHESSLEYSKEWDVSRHYRFAVGSHIDRHVAQCMCSRVLTELTYVFGHVLDVLTSNKNRLDQAPGCITIGHVKDGTRIFEHQFWVARHCSNESFGLCGKRRAQGCNILTSGTTSPSIQPADKLKTTYRVWQHGTWEKAPFVVLHLLGTHTNTAPCRIAATMMSYFELPMWVSTWPRFYSTSLTPLVATSESGKLCVKD